MVMARMYPVWWLRPVLALICFALSTRVLASEGPPPVLHITTYRSPSNNYALTVDPSRLHGGGPGSYRVELNNQLVWEKQLDFTFWEAAICDDGSVVGYAYTSGWRGFDGGRNGDFVTAILNPDGSTRFIDRRPREQTGMMDSPPGPTASGCFLDPSKNRFVVRFRHADMNERGERWEVFDIPQGKRLDDIKLTPPAAPAGSADVWYNAIDIRAIPGTDLALVAWSRTQWQPRQQGVRLSLVDAGAREVWGLERPTDFDAIEHFTPWMIPLLKLLPPPTSLSFSFRSPADQARITFSLTRVESEPHGWLVRETARVAEVVPTEFRPDISPALATITLAARGVIALQVGKDADAQPLNVFDFNFDTKGRIGFIPRSDAGQLEFTLYSADGKKEKVIPLVGLDEHTTLPRAVCVGEDKWVLLACPPGDNTVSRGFSLDASTGTLVPIKDFDCPHSFSQDIKATAGRFAVLGDFRDSQVAAFDHAGKKLWSLPNPVLSAQDIAFSSRGELGVLGGIDNKIVVFDTSGTVVRTIDLNSSLGHRPNYVAGLEADAGGGWILNDFNGSPPIYRLDSEGKVIAKFTPRFADGREFSMYGNVQRAPDGRLWTSDSASLLRLTDDGVVDFVIGRKPETNSLGEVRCATIDTKGNVYAVDAHNASVHVFDSQGKFLRLLKPDPTDFASTSGIGAITIDGEGAIYYLPASFSLNGSRYLKIGADGKRVGFQKAISGEVCDEWFFRRQSQERLVLGYERAFLTDAEGIKTKTIERRADRRWLDKPDQAAFAPDGSFIILARPSSWADGDSTSVTLFSAAGEALKTFDLPRSISYPRGATNGKTIIVTSGESAIVVDVASGGMKQWSLPPETEKSWWEPFISPDGKELWCIDNERKSVFRFEMP